MIHSGELSRCYNSNIMITLLNFITLHFQVTGLYKIGHFMFALGHQAYCLITDGFDKDQRNAVEFPTLYSWS